MFPIYRTRKFIACVPAACLLLVFVYSASSQSLQMKPKYDDSAVEIALVDPADDPGAGGCLHGRVESMSDLAARYGVPRYKTLQALLEERRDELDGVLVAAQRAPLAQQRITAGRFTRRAVEMQAIDQFLLRSRRDMTPAGQPAHVPALCQLRAQDRPRAERVAAVHRQAVIENVKDTSHSGNFLPKKV